MIIRRDEVDETIAYANITSVRISRSAGNEYRMVIRADGHESIIISNQSLTPGGLMEDRSAGYALLVRVLHLHLKGKSHADFKAGCDLEKVLKLTLICAGFSFILSFLGDYVGIRILNPYVQALILSLSSMMFIVIFNVRDMPQKYQPTNIPLQFLP